MIIEKYKNLKLINEVVVEEHRIRL